MCQCIDEVISIVDNKCDGLFNFIFSLFWFAQLGSLGIFHRTSTSWNYNVKMAGNLFNWKSSYFKLRWVDCVRTLGKYDICICVWCFCYHKKKNETIAVSHSFLFSFKRANSVTNFGISLKCKTFVCSLCLQIHNEWVQSTLPARITI